MSLTEMDVRYPKTENEALDLLEKYDDYLLCAGGTDILVQIKKGEGTPPGLISLNKVKELRGIKKQKDEVKIGALTTHAEIAGSKTIKKHLPILRSAAERVGGTQIQNRGTIGGNIANSSPAADLSTCLMVLNAKIRTNKNKIPILEFFVGPKENILDSDEIIENFSIPVPNKNYNQSFNKIGQRKSMSISIVNLALLLDAEKEKIIRDVRIGLGSVAPVPIRAKNTEDALRGNSWSFESFSIIEDSIPDDISPISDLRGSATYRETVTKRLLFYEISRMLGKEELIREAVDIVRKN